jgi:protein SCO1
MPTDLRPTDERPGDEGGAPAAGGTGGASTSAGRRRDPATTVVAALVAVGGVVLLAIAAWFILTGDDDPDPDDPDTWNGALLHEPDPRPDFTLTDADTGEPFDFGAETGGQLTLLFFGYTSCPDICPIQMHILAQALRQSGMPQPTVVFVGTDTERDTPERIREFLDQHNSDFVGLTGTPEEIAAAEAAAGVPASMVLPDDTSGDPVDEGSDDYLVGHASQVIAYTPDDLAHVVYPEGTRQQDWTTDLPRLLEEFGSPSGADGAGGR